MGDGPEVNRLDFETMSRALEKCGTIIREREARIEELAGALSRSVDAGEALASMAQALVARVEERDATIASLRTQLSEQGNFW